MKELRRLSVNHLKKYQILVQDPLVQFRDVYWWREEYYHRHSSQ